MPNEDEDVQVPVITGNPAINGVIGAVNGFSGSNNVNVPAPVAGAINNAQNFMEGLDVFEKAKYYINLYAVFYLASVVLLIGILFIFSKPLLAMATGKAGAVAKVVGGAK